MDFTSYSNQSSGGDELGTQWLLEKERVVIWDAEVEGGQRQVAFSSPVFLPGHNGASWFEGVAAKRSLR